jgi:hypothetical protein
MKSLFKFMARLVPLAIVIAPISAEPDPQPPVTLTRCAFETYAADWEGVAGRVYFMQWSTDLATWSYCPFMDFGDGMHSRGIESHTPKLFFRLHYGDYPAITTLEEARNADFDGDGLSNIFEITHGYSPYNSASTADGDDNALDPDQDGMSNATEQAKGLDPMKKDHPELILQVVAE